jgi:hypothetical protein
VQVIAVPPLLESPSKKLTVPEGMPSPAVTVLTVAVKATLCPMRILALDRVRTVWVACDGVVVGDGEGSTVVVSVGVPVLVSVEAGVVLGTGVSVDVSVLVAVSVGVLVLVSVAIVAQKKKSSETKEDGMSYPEAHK